LTAVSKCKCEIIKNTQWVYLKGKSFNGTELLKINREERISTEEIMKHHWLQESEVSHQLKNRKRLTWR
jgi:DNA-binding response OmpR family regulator